LRKQLALAIGLALALAGCSKVSGPADSGRANSFTHPHVLTYADAQDVNTLNPHLGQLTSVGYIAQMTMAWLIRWNEHNEPYPELATEVPTQKNGGVSKDGLTITYHLRKGVKWSDGAPFDADDVVFSTNVVNNPANNEVGRQGWDQIVKIDEPDKYTVVYHLKKPYSPFIETFFSSAGANPCILPKHLLAQYPNINNVPYNEKPVGIGPFKVDRWDRAQQVVLVANPLYWRGRPKLDKVIYKILPDRNTVLAQLQSHELDMWTVVSASYINRVRGIPGYTVLQQPGYSWNHIDFNTQRPLLRDVKVRQALRLAVDRPEIVDKIYHGVGTLQEVTTPITAPYHVADIPKVPFDLAQANALLDKGGWVLGSDGIRTKGGQRLVLDVATNTGSPDTDNMIELIRGNWNKIGVGMNVHHYASALMFAPLQQGGIVYSNKWDVIFFAWVNEAVGDYSQIYGCNALPPHGQNDPRWCNQKAWAAMQALYTHYDQAERNKDIVIIQRELVNDVAAPVMKLNQDIYAHNKDLKNFHPNGVSQFDNMMDVDI
jgi:peptide/nickel transport system substrate-binding protein